jgi:hypothetical protein
MTSWSLIRISLNLLTTKNSIDHNETNCAGILEPVGDRNRVGIGLSYRPARPHRLPGSLRVFKFGLSAGILEQSMGARSRVGKGFSYRPARLHRLPESIPWQNWHCVENNFSVGSLG